MDGLTPVLIIAVDGKPVADTFYSLIVEFRLRDEEGDAVDTLTIKLDDSGNQIELPRKGAKISVQLGYKETGVVDKGRFEVDRVSIEGSVESGEFLTITANAVDLRKEAKGEGQKAYQDKTLGQIVQAEAGKMKVAAKVDPELAGIPIDYRMRYGQSHIDFVTRLAEEHGGLTKFSGGHLIIQKRGGGKSGSGKTLPPIMIRRTDCSRWSIDPSGRMQYGSVKANWLDKKTGKRKTEKVTTGLQGPDFTVKEDFSNQERAKKAAEAEKGRLNRNTGGGTFELYGRPDAAAGAPVVAVDFRPGIQGDWRASSVEHVFVAGPSGGYTTTVEVKAKEDGKKGNSDD